jgi:hypothetical protein
VCRFSHDQHQGNGCQEQETHNREHFDKANAKFQEPLEDTLLIPEEIAPDSPYKIFDLEPKAGL